MSSFYSSEYTSSTEESQQGKQCNGLVNGKVTNKTNNSTAAAFDKKIRAGASRISAEGTLEDLWDFYNENAEEYEQHRGAVQAALGWQALAKAISAAVSDKNARLPDCGAGAGGAGQFVLQEGFTNIDALEVSSGMLDIARQKNIYSQLYCAALDPDKKVDIADGTYDAMFISASFLPGHIDIKHLPEIVRILKPGGLIMFNVADKYLKEIHNNLLRTFLFKCIQALQYA